MPPWQSIFQQILVAFLAIVFLTTCSSCFGSPCQNLYWWDSLQDKCVECTVCKDQKIVLRPCQWHQDTFCGTIHDLDIDFMYLGRTEPNWKERRKTVDDESINSNIVESEIPWDWQAASLILAAIACLLFFLAAALMLIHHMKQWRQMERRLDRDVEELSTKLMAKLAKVQNHENGSFIIENPINDVHAGPVKIHCVYMDQLLAGKDTKKAAKCGNFYIEEAGSKG